MKFPKVVGGFKLAVKVRNDDITPNLKLEIYVKWAKNRDKKVRILFPECRHTELWHYNWIETTRKRIKEIKKKMERPTGNMTGSSC
jgi:hypothetical protein